MRRDQPNRLCSHRRKKLCDTDGEGGVVAGVLVSQGKEVSSLAGPIKKRTQRILLTKKMMFLQTVRARSPTTCFYIGLNLRLRRKVKAQMMMKFAS